MKIEKFLKKLASTEPAPGGGSASALSGSIGAALLSMVAKLSMKESPKAKNVSKEAEKLSQKCNRLCKADEKAFEAVVAAIELPKTSELQKTKRKQKLEAALKKATEIPMQSAKTALEILEVAENFLNHTKRTLFSDLGVAAVLARAATEGSVLNVLTNLATIKDKQFVNRYFRQAEAVLKEAEILSSRIMKEIHEKLREGTRKI